MTSKTHSPDQSFAGVATRTGADSTHVCPQDGRREAAFVDTSVVGWKVLASGIRASRPGIEVVLIDGTRSGLAQMAAWAETHGGYDALHVLSHGAPAALFLGSDRLTSDALTDGAPISALRGIGAALNLGGALLIYGCHTAQGAAGARFLSNLAAHIGADVTASSHLVGNATLDGNWVLDRRTGPIAVKSLNIADFENVLGTFSSPTSSFTVQGLGNTYTVGQAAGTPNNGVAVLLQSGGYQGPHYIRSYTSTGSLNYTVNVDTLPGVTLPSSNSVNLLALSDGNLLVEYNNEDSGDHGSLNAYYVVLNSSGTEVTGPTQINTATGSTQTRGVHMAQLTNGNIAFAYQESDDQTIGVRVFQENGTPVTAETAITGGQQDGFATSVSASSSGGFMVSYTGYVYHQAGTYYSDWAGYSVYNNAGVLQANAHPLSLDHNGNFPESYSLPLSNGNYLYETSYNGTISGEVYNPSGAAVSPANVGGAFGAGYITPVDTASDPGYATWSYSSAYQNAYNADASFSNVNAGLYLTRYSDGGVVSGAATQVDTGTAKGVWTVSTSGSGYYTVDTVPTYRIYPGYSQGVIEVKTAPNQTDGSTWTIGANLFEMASGPSVTSINRTNSSTLSNATTESFTVTFSTAVSGVAASDFTAASTGSVSTTGVSSVSGSGTTYTVTVAGVSGNGTLGLNLSNIGSIADASNNALTGTHNSDQTYTIDHTAPIIANLSNDADVFVVGAGTVLLDAHGDAAVTEANIASGGVLTVSVSNDQAGEDVLGLKTATGGITTSGSSTVTVSDNGVVIGEYNLANGMFGQNLAIGLAAGDTTTQVADLIHALTYNDTSATPNMSVRTTDVTLTDAAGNVSATNAVTVTPDNRPVVTAGHSPTLARTQTGVALDPSVSVSDIDGNWNRGTFVVQVTSNADATHDTLTLPTTSNAGIWLSGTSLMAGATQIGSASAASAIGGAAWTFTLNAAATSSDVTTLADAIRLSVSSGGSLSTRTVSFVATDGDAIAGTTATDSVSVVTEPSIAGGSPHGVSDTGTISPLSGITISDGATEGVTVAVSFTAALGDFSGMSGWSASTMSGVRAYTRDFASAASANTALAGLLFAPTAHAGAVGSSATATFSVVATGDYGVGDQRRYRGVCRDHLRQHSAGNCCRWRHRAHLLGGSKPDRHRQRHYRHRSR